MRIVTVCLLVGVAGSLSAQEPAPPDSPAPKGSAVHFGLFGFGGSVGVDLDGDADLILAYSADIGDLFTTQLRLRPSFEVGLQGLGDTYVGNFDLIYRFTPDTAIAIPYVGFGLAVQGHEACSTDPNCPSLWAQFALGFELPFRSSFNWLLEYRGEDALRRHRLFLGFVTRRGSS